MPAWMKEHLDGHLFLAVSIGLASLVVSIAVTLIAIVHLPADAFVRKKADLPLPGQPRALRWAALVARNIAGWMLIVLGVVLSLPGVPGQGLLTMLLGLMLTSLPGKRRVELWILRRKPVAKTVNRLRERFHRAPLRLELEQTAESPRPSSSSFPARRDS